MKRVFVVAIVVLGLMALAALTVRAIDDLETPRELHGAPYATSGECQRCHPSHYESWARTFHRTMTQEASEESVLGDFDGASFAYGGVTARMEHGPDGFAMRFYGPDGPISSARVVRAVGSRRVQQYLAADGDVLFRLPIAWNVEEQRWMHMNGAFLTPDPEMPVAREDYHRHVVRWNDNCVFCHNVAPNPGLAQDRFRTETAELGIACEACHGPGDEHARVNADPLRRYALHVSERADPTIVNPARLDPERSAQICGRCHGQRITGEIERFLAHGDPFVPGEDLREYSTPLARDTPLRGDHTAFAARFWPDGTARLTAYEYQGLLQSECTEGDLTCTSCHGMHEGDPRGQIRPELEGDAMCTGCHEDLAGRSHTQHADVRCADCHMPRIVYGLVNVHRSHHIDSPDPGAPRPDACTLCHAERSRAWAIEARARLWHSETSDSDSDLPETLRLAFAGDPIERAVACAALGRADDLRSSEDRKRRLGILLDVMLEDPYPAVRRIAWRSARALTTDRIAWNDYVPEGDREGRRRFVARLRARAIPPDATLTRELRAQAAQVAIEIGE